MNPNTDIEDDEVAIEQMLVAMMIERAGEELHDDAVMMLKTTVRRYPENQAARSALAQRQSLDDIVDDEESIEQMLVSMMIERADQEPHEEATMLLKTATRRYPDNEAAKTTLEKIHSQPAVSQKILTSDQLHAYVMSSDSGELTYDQQRELFANPELKAKLQNLWEQKQQQTASKQIFEMPVAAAAATGRVEEWPFYNKEGGRVGLVEVVESDDADLVYVYITLEEQTHCPKIFYLKSREGEVIRKLDAPDEEGVIEIIADKTDKNDQLLLHILQGKNVQAEFI